VSLLRHAHGVPRSVWRLEGGSEELLRPLSPRGRRQAEAVARHLVTCRPGRIFSGPAFRCQQTVEPLAVALGLPVEVDDRLGEGEDPDSVLELLAGLGDTPSVLCTHATLLSPLLQLLEVDAPEPDGACRKGALWQLCGPAVGPVAGQYVEPELRIRASVRTHGVRPQSVRAAVLDLGSTSFNLLIADVYATGQIRPVVREKVMLRLGAVMANRDRIPGDVTHRVLKVARELRRVVKHEKVQHFLPVATAALREARNGAKISEKLGKVLKTDVHVLSGEEEARLMFRAFQRRLSLDSRSVVGLDLGGGSLELAAGCSERLECEATLPLGVVRLHSAFVRGDPMGAVDAASIADAVRASLEPVAKKFPALLRSDAIATGGVVRALARLVASRRTPGADIDALPLALDVDELRALDDELAFSNHQECLALPGVRRRRADLLPTGAGILRGVAEVLGIERFTFCDWGLREGVLLEKFSGTLSGSV
jgi:exopolyphosphatase/guanosine-5'-triphosphate,3'-diphosphate pyrophosphatase